MNIQELKASNPIEQVAARYGTLHRAGANYKMLCPFHDDHHPSLSLHVGGQYFKCHACGAGGDVIGLVMGLEHCSFTEAVGRLGGCGPAEAKVSATTQKERKEKVSTRDRALRLEANRRFLATLVPCASGHTELSGAWLDFGVAQATAFVPDDYRFLRGRTVFPIFNVAGELTGFSGRRSPSAPEGEPKYINSPNSSLFDKSRMLYGIHRAAEPIRQAGFAYLTEGYKDALAMHAAGFTNTLALGGTAFTSEQAAALRAFCDRAVLLLDNDPAGQAATERLLSEPPGGLGLESLRLPTAKDPDELFRRLGRAGFRLYMQLLTERVGAGEKRLLAFCLKHPGVAPEVERMLADDDMPFASETYRNLLHFVALRQPLHALPASEHLLAAILSATLPALPLPAGVPVSLLSEEEETICHELAWHFCLEHYEDRILAETSRLAAALKAGTSGENDSGIPSESRTALLTSFSRHVSMLVGLTESLSRTPVVNCRW